MRVVLLLGALVIATPAWADPPAPAGSSPVESSQPLQPIAPDGSPVHAETLGWRDANERVGEFPRGHIDLLRWEAERGAQASTGMDAAATTQVNEQALLRRSLALRPDLFIQPGMSPAEQAHVQRAYVEHALALRHAWIDAIAAGERLNLAQSSAEAAEAAALLGQRMAQVGTWRQARYQATQQSHLLARQALRSAQLQFATAQGHLFGLIGASGDEADRIRLPDTLPVPPAQARAADGLEARAVANDTALQLLRQQVGLQLAATNAARLTQLREAIERTLTTLPEVEQADSPAPLAALPPRLSQRDLPVDHAPFAALSAQLELQRAETDRRRQVQLAYLAYRNHHASALEHHAGLMPIAAALEEDRLLRYNGMLDSTWGLLDSARARIAAVDAAVQAKRTFWRAEADLQAVLAGARYSGAEGGSIQTSTASTPGDH